MFQRRLIQTFSSTPIGRHRCLSRVAANSSIVLGRHVREALANGCPVVALESTVITHGLPEPQNLELALKLEREIADGLWWAPEGEMGGEETSSMRGVVTPATVGIIKGQLVVGLSREQLEFLANAKLSRPIKASRRDIPVAQALRLSAGTTVSATMAIATSCTVDFGSRDLTGISVFATGGLGGVHLGGERSMDISADLYEMMQTPIGLVSSGFKSFLDTRRSLELLESLGCTVVSLKPDEGAYLASEATRHRDKSTEELDIKLRTCQPFPGFFTTINKESVRSPWQCASVQEAAQILYHCLGAQFGRANCSGTSASNVESCSPIRLRDSRAMLLACPIPSQFSVDHEATERNENNYSNELLDEICNQIDKRHDLAGNEKTPLILAQLNRLTGGKTLGANLELLRNNARVGAHLAYELAELRQQVGCVSSSSSSSGLVELYNGGEWAAGQWQTTRRASGDGLAMGAAVPPDKRRAPKGKSPIVVGCTMIDMHVRTKMDARFKANPTHSGVTYDGEPKLVLGGVGRNLAAALELLGNEPTFVTALAGDNLGEFARGQLVKLFGGASGREFNRDNDQQPPATRQRLEILKWTGHAGASSCFALVLIDSLSGQCEFVIANLEAQRAISRANLESLFGSRQQLAPLLHSAPLLILDANLPQESVEFMLQLGHRCLVPVFIEPTDVNCLPDLVQLLSRLEMDKKSCRRALVCLSPNAIELETMLKLFALGDQSKPTTSEPKTVDDIRAMARELMERHLPELTCLLVTLDSRGVLVGLRTAASAHEIDLMTLNQLWRFESDKAPPTKQKIVFKHFPPTSIVPSPVSASGAGDCFAAGFISGAINERPLRECIELGFEAAHCALMDTNTVPDSLAELN